MTTANRRSRAARPREALLAGDQGQGYRRGEAPDGLSLIVAGAKGVGSVDENTFVQIMKSANYTLNRFEIKDEKIRMLRDDVAVIAYQVREELTVDGKPVTLNASDCQRGYAGMAGGCAPRTRSRSPVIRTAAIGRFSYSFLPASRASADWASETSRRSRVPGADTTPRNRAYARRRPRRGPAPPRASPAPA